MDIEKIRDIALAGDYAKAASACLDISPQHKFLKHFRARCLLLNGDFASFGNLLKKSNSLVLESAYYYYRIHDLETAISTLDEVNVEDLSAHDQNIAGLLRAQILQRQSKGDESRHILWKKLVGSTDNDEKIDLVTNMLSSPGQLSKEQRSFANSLIHENDNNDVFEMMFNIFVFNSIHNPPLDIDMKGITEAANYIDNLDGVLNNSASLTLQTGYVAQIKGNSNLAAEKYEEILKLDSSIPEWLQLVAAFNLYICDSSNLLASKTIIRYGSHLEDFYLKSKVTKNFMKSLPVSLIEPISLNYCKWLLDGFKFGPVLSISKKIAKLYPSTIDDLVLIRARLYLTRRKKAMAHSVVDAHVKQLDHKQKDDFLAAYLFVLFSMKVKHKDQLSYVLEELGTSKYSKYFKLCLACVPDKGEFLREAFSVAIKQELSSLLDITGYLIRYYLDIKEFSEVLHVIEEYSAAKNDTTTFLKEEVTARAFVDPMSVKAEVLKLTSDLSISLSIEEILAQGVPVSKDADDTVSQEEIRSTIKARKKAKSKAYRKKKYLASLVAKGIAPKEGEIKLDPERWIPKRLRKANLRKKKKDKKLTGGQGVVNEAVGAKLDVRANLDKKSKKSKYGNKKRRGRR